MRSRMRKALTISMFVIAFPAAESALATTYSSLVVFGDSLADTGNNALAIDVGLWQPAFQPGDRTSTPIPDNSFDPDLPYASNRYSNGPVWTDYLASGMGFRLQPSLLPGGNNYAFGGALSGPGGQVPSILDQMGMYLAGTGGHAQSDALYIVEAGGNDVRAALATHDPVAILHAIGAYSDNIQSVVASLIGAGARNILVADVPDIGKVPSIQALGPQIAAQASAISAAMNAGLSAKLGALPSLGADIDILDLFGLLDELVANPARFGFSDVTDACAASQACIDNPAGTFFWDGLHATTAGAMTIAYAAEVAIGALPEPAPALLFAAVLLAVMLVPGRRTPGQRMTVGR